MGELLLEALIYLLTFWIGDRVQPRTQVKVLAAAYALLIAIALSAIGCAYLAR